MEILFIAACGAISVVMLWQSFRALIKARTIEDVPTSKIRSAPQGYVELSGSASSGELPLLPAPLTGTKCLWYHYTIERYQRSGKSSRWRVVEHGSSEQPLMLTDGTGECLVDPRGADVTTLSRRRWRGSTRRPSGAPTKNRLFGGGKYRYTERCILAEQWLYAVGEFTSAHPDSPEEQAKSRAAQMLRDWKQDPAQMKQRFDLDRDGSVDQFEWEQARVEAGRRARREVTQNYDHTPLHGLRKPADGRPFLISSKDPAQLTGHYRRNAFMLLVMAGIFAATTVAMILQR